MTSFPNTSPVISSSSPLNYKTFLTFSQILLFIYFQKATIRSLVVDFFFLWANARNLEYASYTCINPHIYQIFSVQLHDKRSAPQDQIFFLLNDGFIRQISCSPDSEPSVIEIYPCVNSVASQTGSRAMEGSHSGLLSKYEWEMSADLGDLPIHITGLTFPSKRPTSLCIVRSTDPSLGDFFFFLKILPM